MQGRFAPLGLMVAVACAGSSPAKGAPELGFVLEFEQTALADVAGLCLQGKPEIDEATGMARCTIVEESSCGAGRISSSGRCVVCQLGDGTLQDRDAAGHDVSGCSAFQPGDGWEYEAAEDSPECPSGGAIRFRGAGVPEPGARVRIECLRDRHPLDPTLPAPSGSDAGS